MMKKVIVISAPHKTKIALKQVFEHHFQKLFDRLTGSKYVVYNLLRLIERRKKCLIKPSISYGARPKLISIATSIDNTANLVECRRRVYK